MSKYYIKFVLSISFVLAVSLLGGLFLVNQTQAYSDGVLIKAVNNPDIYVINNGMKVWVRSADVFNGCGYDWSKIQTVSSLSLTPTADLIKSASSPDVYRLQKNFKRKINSAEIFKSYGLRWDKIVTVCPAVFDSYPLAILIKAQGSPDIYRIDHYNYKTEYFEGGRPWYHRYGNMAVFLADGMSIKDVIEINTMDKSSYLLSWDINEVLPQPPTLNFYNLDSIINAGTDFTVYWTNVDKATGYILERSTDSEFKTAQNIYDEAALPMWRLVNYVDQNIMPTITTNYYYRVKAFGVWSGGQYQTDWSKPITIQVNTGCAAPLAPVLTASVGEIISNEVFTFSWTKVNNATSYILERDTNNLFLQATTVYSGADNANIAEQLSPVNNSSYFYRVRAANACGKGSRSNITEVKVKVVNIPSDKPTWSVPNALYVVFPLNGSVHISWWPVVGATYYVIEWNKGASIWRTPVFDEKNSLKTTGIYLDEPADSVGRWYYRIRAVNEVGSGPWSDVLALEVQPSLVEITVSAHEVQTGQQQPYTLYETQAGQPYTLSWDKPAYIDHFVMKWCVEPCNYTEAAQEILIDPSVSYVLSPAVTTTYSYWVKAVAIGGVEGVFGWPARGWPVKVVVSVP